MESADSESRDIARNCTLIFLAALEAHLALRPRHWALRAAVCHPPHGSARKPTRATRRPGDRQECLSHCLKVLLVGFAAFSPPYALF